MELLPPPGPDGDPVGAVEVFDQLGPVPAGFTPRSLQEPAYETPPTAPPAAPAQPADAPTPATTPLGVFGPSETGSFHLPPPLHATAPMPQAAQPMSMPMSTPTAPTAPHPYAPAPLHPAPPAAPRTTALAPPPRTVTAGILLAAVLCFAVGIWALTQV